MSQPQQLSCQPTVGAPWCVSRLSARGWIGSPKTTQGMSALREGGDGGSRTNGPYIPPAGAGAQERLAPPLPAAVDVRGAPAIRAESGPCAGPATPRRFAAPG